MRATTASPAMRLVIVAAALLALLAAACGGDRGAKAPQPRTTTADLPTEDVAPPPDARVDVTRDRQEHRHAETFSGVLPSGFPRNLPLPPQASLVDQGRGWIEVLVPRHPAAVEQPYLAQLRTGGWTVSTAAAHAWTLRRGGRDVRLELHAQGPSTRLHLAY